MKNIYISSLILALAISAKASSVLLGGLTTVNNTTSNSTSVIVSSVTVPSQRLFVSHSGLTSINNLVGYAQVSLDGTNFVNIATYTPSSTNAETESVTMGSSSNAIYLRFSAVTTNSVGVGVILQ